MAIVTCSTPGVVILSYTEMHGRFCLYMCSTIWQSDMEAICKGSQIDVDVSPPATLLSLVGCPTPLMSAQDEHNRTAGHTCKHTAHELFDD